MCYYAIPLHKSLKATKKSIIIKSGSVFGCNEGRARQEGGSHRVQENTRDAEYVNHLLYRSLNRCVNLSGIHLTLYSLRHSSYISVSLHLRKALSRQCEVTTLEEKPELSAFGPH